MDFTQFLLCESSEPGHVWDPHGLFGERDEGDQVRCSYCGIGEDDYGCLRVWARNFIELESFIALESLSLES